MVVYQLLVTADCLVPVAQLVVRFTTEIKRVIGKGTLGIFRDSLGKRGDGICQQGRLVIPLLLSCNRETAPAELLVSFLGGFQGLVLGDCEVE